MGQEKGRSYEKNIAEEKDLILSRYNNPNYIFKLHFLEAGEILKVARDKIIEQQLWEKWLAEYQLSPYSETPVKSFESYKRQIFEYARLKSRTKEEKEAEFEAIKRDAENAIRILDPHNDMVRRKVDLRKKVSLKKKVKTNVRSV